jgi:hypothetical protein
MITVPSKEILFALPRKPKENELACVENSHTIYKANSEGKWEEIKIDGGLTLSLYELNKTAMAQMSEMTAAQKKDAIELIQKYTKEAVSGTYYMLLGREINYYTVFPVLPDSHSAIPISSTVLECAADVGKIVDVSLNDANAIEIWVKTQNDAACLVFFDYTMGVVPVKVD